MSSYSKLIALMAAGAILAGGAATAQAQPAPLVDDGSTRLLQSEMTQRGWGGDEMEKYGLSLTGHVQAAWNYNFQTPPGHYNGWGILFGDKYNDPTLNQIDLKLMRAIQYSSEKLDFGFTIEVIYGSDVRYTQANGTNFYGSGYAQQRDLTFFNAAPPFNTVVQSVGFPGQSNPENQFDFIQMNVTANLPVGNGIMMTAGKMVAPWGFETTDPVTTPFYSHSYIFGLSTPRTITGLTAGYQFDENWSGMGGIIVGWNQAFKDNNDFPSFILQGGYASEENWNIVVTTVFGPEQPDDDSNWRFLCDLTIEWKWSEFDFGLEGVVGWEQDISTPRNSIPLQTGGFADFQQFEGDDAWWFGAMVYGGCYIDQEKRLYIQGRLEYFNDTDGALLLSSDVYSATLGLLIKPFPHDRFGQNLVFRPEIRYDYSDDDIFGAGTQNWQITAGIDCIYKF